MLKADSRCEKCLCDLADAMVGLAAEASGPEDVSALQSAVRAIVARDIPLGLASPVIAKNMLEETLRLSGVDDPYEDFKEKETARAREIFSGLEKAGAHDLRSLAGLAVLGNTLDFFRDPDLVLLEVPELLRKGVRFVRDDIHRLEEFLRGGPRDILYLTDNSGEIYFDLPLYRFLKVRSRSCFLVVKGGPALNDLTRKEIARGEPDLQSVDLADTGTPGPGVDWKSASVEFLSLVRRADLIVSKGMANFETIYKESLDPSVLFLFRVKCEPIQDASSVPMGGFAALWQEGKKERPFRAARCRASPPIA